MKPVDLSTFDDSGSIVRFERMFDKWKRPTVEQWLAERNSAIGGSDAPVVVGVSPWKSRQQLWGEKAGLLEPEKLDSDAVEMGKELEPVVLSRYAKKSGRPAIAWPSTIVASGAGHVPRFMRCTPDGLTWDPERGLGLVQIKTTGEFSRGEWDDGPPLHVEVQTQHEMFVTSARWAAIVVLIGGRTIKWWDVTPNASFVEALVDDERQFWQHVTERVCPVVTVADAAADASRDGALGKTLAKLYGDGDASSVMLEPEAIAWDERLREIKAQQKALEAERDALEALLKDRIGSASVGVLPNGRAYSWLSWSRSGYTVGPSSGRTLRQVGKR